MKKLPLYLALAFLGACANPTTTEDDTNKGNGTQQDLAGGSGAQNDSTAATVVTGAVGAQMTDMTGVDERPAEDPNAPGAAVTPDANFINSVLSDGTFEIQMAQRVLADKPDANLRAFAEAMVRDHTKTGDELRLIAKAQKMNVTDRPNREQIGIVARAEKLTGKELRGLYATSTVKGHETAVALFKTASASADRPELKAFAAKTLPTLEMHLKMAQDLQAGRPMMKM